MKQRKKKKKLLYDSVNESISLKIEHLWGPSVYAYW